MFSKIFRENSIKLRKEFFANELVRYLWSRYISNERNELKDYINRLRKTVPYQGHVEILVGDILALQQDMDFTILKPEHLN